MFADTGPVAVLQAWVSAHPRYTYTVDATERSATGTSVPATLRISVDTAKNTEDVRVVRGQGAGSDIHWSGSDTVTVRGPGIAHVFSVRMNVRDPRILSPRHNDIRTGIFARAAQCFSTDAARVRTAPGPAHATVMILNKPRGIVCGPEYGDGTIVTDRVTLDASDGHPLVRERLDGTGVVERWVIHDLSAPA